MTKQEIQEYVAHTPYNTNPAIIGSMIDELGGGGGDTPTVHITIDSSDGTTFTSDTTVTEFYNLLEDETQAVNIEVIDDYYNNKTYHLTKDSVIEIYDTWICIEIVDENPSDHIMLIFDGSNNVAISEGISIDFSRESASYLLPTLEFLNDNLAQKRLVHFTTTSGLSVIWVTTTNSNFVFMYYTSIGNTIQIYSGKINRTTGAINTEELATFNPRL